MVHASTLVSRVERLELAIMPTKRKDRPTASAAAAPPAAGGRSSSGDADPSASRPAKKRKEKENVAVAVAGRPTRRQGGAQQAAAAAASASNASDRPVDSSAAGIASSLPVASSASSASARSSTPANNSAIPPALPALGRRPSPAIAATSRSRSAHQYQAAANRNNDDSGGGGGSVIDIADTDSPDSSRSPRGPEQQRQRQQQQQQQAACSTCAICFHTTSSPTSLVTLPCCGIHSESTSTTRFCPNCIAALARRDMFTHKVDDRSLNFGKRWCRLGECPRCGDIIAVTSRIGGGAAATSTSARSQQCDGGNFPMHPPSAGSGPSGTSTSRSTRTDWSVEDIGLQRATMGQIIAYACDGAGREQRQGEGGGRNGNGNNDNGNGNNAAGNRRRSSIASCLGFLAYTPSPGWIPEEVFGNVGKEYFPKLVRWGLLEAKKRRGRLLLLGRRGRQTVVYAMTAENQAWLREVRPNQFVWGTEDHPNIAANVEWLRQCLGLDDVEDVDATIQQIVVSLQLLGSALYCLLCLWPWYALRLWNQGLTAFAMSFGIIPGRGRRGPPVLSTWQSFVVAIMNASACCLAVRGLVGVLKSGIGYGLAVAITIKFGGCIVSRKPIPRWALNVILIRAHLFTEHYFSVWRYAVLYFVCVFVCAILRKDDADLLPYWLYGVLLFERFFGVQAWPIIIDATMGGPGVFAGIRGLLN